MSLLFSYLLIVGAYCICPEIIGHVQRAPTTKGYFMSKKIKLVVLYGGVSSEHIISVSSAETLIKHLNPERYLVKPAYITQTGIWVLADKFYNLKYAGGELANFISISKALANNEIKLSDVTFPQGVDNILTDKPDVVFIIMHGVNGEDGTIQGMLEYLGLNYTGSDVLSSALCMHKVYSKQIYQLNKIPTPSFLVIQRKQWKTNNADVIKKAVKEMGLPLVIKIPAEGSSIGMDICYSEKSLKASMNKLFSNASFLMVEEFIDGIEGTCGVLKESKEGECIALPPTEIVLKQPQYFDYYAKYTPGATDEITPARLPEKLIKKIQKYSIIVHQALGCGSMSRSDMIVREGIPYFLETNTIPGMTPTSLYPQGAKAYGISFTELLDKIIRYSL